MKADQLAALGVGFLLAAAAMNFLAIITDSVPASFIAIACGIAGVSSLVVSLGRSDR